jgi:hypothetical protein
MTESHAPRQSYSSRETVQSGCSAIDRPGFKIIIVGGSIAGLTLAHCLDRAGIDHIVLEKANDIAPQVGTSIGVSPNGARILDQLGVYEEIEKCIEPLNVATVSYPDGFHFSSRYPKIIGERSVTVHPLQSLFFGTLEFMLGIKQVRLSNSFPGSTEIAPNSLQQIPKEGQYLPQQKGGQHPEVRRRSGRQYRRWKHLYRAAGRRCRWCS